MMCLCWKENPLMRPTFADITKQFPYYLQRYKVHFLFFFNFSREELSIADIFRHATKAQVSLTYLWYTCR